MINKSIINIFFHFMLFFVIFIIVLELLAFLMLKNKDKQIKGKRINLFGLFMELDNLTILAIAVLIIRYEFIVYSIFSNDAVIYVHLVILLILGILFGLTSLSFKNLIIETVSSIAIYFGLVCSKLLASYLIDVRFEWYVSLGNICLIVFMLIYITFFLFRNINDIVSRTRYIRRERNEDN